MKQTLLSFFLAVFYLTLSAQQVYWQQRVNYTIDVSLNNVEHSLEAFENVVYFNNSPDTLHFIWFHIWPNAFKTDRTAFSEQLLVNNRTDFYFSNQQQKGYINRLDFKVNGSTAKTENHPQFIDIIKLLLPRPLAPQDSIIITTPFHVKLPDNFSRGGHVKQSYQVTQWYPKPAVYDRKGWHTMPYLDQGEFYSEFGDYDVRITLPVNYILAATGMLQNTDELAWLKEKARFQVDATGPVMVTGTNNRSSKQSHRLPVNDFPPTSPSSKTLRYVQKDVHDFAWFADRRFLIHYDTLRLNSGKVVDVFAYFLPGKATAWKNSVEFIKKAVISRSELLGEYPFDVVSAVEAKLGSPGGMEYPTIASISLLKDEKTLAKIITHEVTHNWFYATLASNERRYPWMDEGMNTYYDERDKETRKEINTRKMLSSRLPPNPELLAFESLARQKKDQPINTSSEKFTPSNYGLVAYFKAGQWMSLLDSLLGRQVFDSAMHEYYSIWKFRHPYPEDFQRVMEHVSGRNLDFHFRKLDTTGSLLSPQKKVSRVVPFFNLRNTQAVNHISVVPAIGGNLYDGLMIGVMLHNFQLPLNRFSFFAIPMFATRSKQLNGLARMSYSWYPAGFTQRIDAGLNAAKFSMNDFQPEGGKLMFAGYRKFVPFVKITFKNPDPLSRKESYLLFKSFLVREGVFSFRQSVTGTDTSNILSLLHQNIALQQLKFVVSNQRKLYPYLAAFQLEHHRFFTRAAFTGNYFFNYSNNQAGLFVRVFAGKFFYNQVKTSSRQFETERFHLNLTGPNGYEDYTYSDYFAGRNKFQNWASQQVMIRDGAFKVRTDLLSNKVGKTDNWLSAVNFRTNLPGNLNPLSLLPFNVPLSVFADIGTYAEAWDKNSETGRFLFDAGLQVSLFKEMVNIYFPLVYSSVFRDYYKSTLGEKRFLKTISFSFNFKLSAFSPQLSVVSPD